MTKYKIGDRVRVVTTKSPYEQWIGKTLTITKTDSLGDYNYDVRENSFSWKDEELELVTEGGALMARKTYKLKKDTPTVRKGAILQEACDDGTQEYILITPESSRDQQAPASAKLMIFDRSLVEEQPTWFEEVFAVEPQYMTREELDQWEAFKAGPAVRDGNARVSGSISARKKRTWTDEQRAAHGAKIKAANRRKKAAAKRAA